MAISQTAQGFPDRQCGTGNSVADRQPEKIGDAIDHPDTGGR